MGLQLASLELGVEFGVWFGSWICTAKEVTHSQGLIYELKGLDGCFNGGRFMWQ